MQDERKIVILDTDIGGDIDDTWALGMLLKIPKLNTRLVVSATYNTAYRAKLIAKFLEQAGRSDIDVGVGIKQACDNKINRQEAWVEEYELSDYPGKVFQDGVQAIIDLIMSSESEVTLIGIAPMPNIAEALTQVSHFLTKTPENKGF